MKRFLLIVLGLVAMVTGAGATGFLPGAYTIQPYNAQDKYVQANWTTETAGTNKAKYTTTPTVDNGAVWNIVVSGQGDSYRCFCPASSSFTVSYLDAWDGDSGTIGSWNTENANQSWTITAVDGLTDVYTIASYGKSGQYMLYNSESEYLYHSNAAVTTANYFIIKPVNHYTATIVGDATAGDDAKFTWTPTAGKGSDALARQKVAATIGNNSTTTVAYSGGIIWTATATDASEFSISGVTPTKTDATPSVSVEADATSAGNNIVTFAYPYKYTWTVVTKSADGTTTVDNPTADIKVTYNSTDYTFDKTNADKNVIYSKDGTLITNVDLTQAKIDGYNALGATIDADTKTITLNYQVHGTLPTAWTDAAPKFYRFKSLRSSNYAYWDNTKTGSDSRILQVNADNVASKGASAIWFTMAGTNDGESYLYNLTNTSLRVNGVSADRTEAGTVYYLYVPDTETYSGYTKGFAISTSATPTVYGAWNEQGSGAHVGTWYVTSSSESTTIDNGSMWDYEEVPASEAWSYWMAANKPAADDYDILMGSVFGPTKAQVTTYKSSVASAYTTTAYDTDKTWSGNVAVLDAAVTAAKTTCETDWNTTFPTTQGKYIIYNKNRGKYLADTGASDNQFHGIETKYAANAVWEFIPGTTSGQFKIRNRATGNFIKNQEQASWTAQIITSLNRDNATYFEVNEADASLAGMAVIKSAGSTATAQSSCMHLDGYNKLVSWSNSEASQWIFYPIDTDILEASTSDATVNYLIKNNSSGKYASSTISNSYMTQVALASGDNSIVWNFTASTTEDAPSYAYKLSTQATAAGDTPYLNAINSFSADGADWYVRFSDYNGQCYSITSNSGDLPQDGWNNWQGAGNYIGSWTSNGAGSVWKIEKLDRVLDDAEYALSKNLANYASYNDASKDFWFNTDLYNKYTYWTNGKTDDGSAAGYDAATEFAFYQKVAAKAAGFVDTDFNIPMAGFYAIKNKRGGYLALTANDAGTYNATYTSTVKSNANFFNVKFERNETTGNVVCYIKNLAKSVYVNSPSGSNVTATTTEATGDYTTFQIIPGVQVNASYNGYVAFGASNNSSNGTFLNKATTYIVGWSVDEGSCWTIEPISTYAATLLTKANTAYSTADTDWFHVNTDKKTTFKGYIDALTTSQAAGIATSTTDIAYISGSTFTDYKNLEEYYADRSNYDMPSTGRYLIKNKGTGKYLNNYGSPLVTISDPGYYSIWDLTYDATTNTYSFLNEGAAYVQEPYGTAPGKGYLTYDESISSTSSYTYKMGGSACTMIFEPAGNGYAYMKCSSDPYHCTIASMENAPQVEGHLNGQHYDETVQSYIANTDWDLWTLEQFDAGENTTDASGNVTKYGEASIYYNMSNTKKAGYVGGPITLTNVDGVPTLKALNKLIDDNKTKIAATTSPEDIANGSTNAALYKQVIDYIHNTLESKYQLTLAEGKVFYLQNLSRPSAQARLVNLENATQCHTVATTDDYYSTEYAQWTMETANATDGTFYIKNVGTQKYISSRSATSGKNMVMTTSTDDAAQIALTEVVPGVYLVYDNIAGNTEKYMTIGGSPYNLTYYYQIELSTMWKIYSLNEVVAEGCKDITTPITDKVGDKSVSLAKFTTFSYPVTTQVASNIGALVYYGTKAHMTEGKLYVDLYQLKASNGYYNMEPNKGYALLTTSASTFDAAKSITMSSSSASSTEDILVASSPITITSDNWTQYYVMEYHTSDEIVGTWHGKNLRGVGLGFYRPVVGSTIKEHSAYLPDGLFTNWDKESYKPSTFDDEAARSLDYSWQGAEEDGPGQIPCEIVLHAPDGTVTGIVKTDADGQMRIHKVYDLNGRQLQEAKSGINIIDGKTVIVR